jgi:hypothetical protein
MVDFVFAFESVRSILLSSKLDSLEFLEFIDLNFHEETQSCS